MFHDLSFFLPLSFELFELSLSQSAGSWAKWNLSNRYPTVWLFRIHFMIELNIFIYARFNHMHTHTNTNSSCESRQQRMAIAFARFEFISDLSHNFIEIVHKLNCTFLKWPPRLLSIWNVSIMIFSNCPAHIRIYILWWRSFMLIMSADSWLNFRPAAPTNTQATHAISLCNVISTSK